MFTLEPARFASPTGRRGPCRAFAERLWRVSKTMVGGEGIEPPTLSV